MEVITDEERRLAADVAGLAMISGWETSIRRNARETGLSEGQIKLILNKALEYNDMADPNGRIPSLEDWKREKQGYSRLAAARGPGKTPRLIPETPEALKSVAPASSGSRER